MAKYIFNTPVLTNYGVYRFLKVDLEEAKRLAEDAQSAVGHTGTADALSTLLGMKIKMNRVEVRMEPGDTALVFWITARLPEGAILSGEETLKMPYELGKLERIA